MAEPSSKSQLLVISLAVLLFLGLYLGVDTKPRDRAQIDQSRALAAESTNITALLRSAKAEMPPDISAFVLSYEKELEIAKTDTARSAALKKLSRHWYQFGKYGIAGFYAEQVAELENTEEAWSIAGTTFAIGISAAQEDKEKRFCSGRAVSAFEKAISIAPEVSQHKLNLAICYAEFPPADNPMKGIQMLLDLNRKEPENVPVLTTLARFGIKTGQFDKAIERLNKALALEPDNVKAVCLLAEAYDGKGLANDAKAFFEKCEALAKSQQ